MLEVIYLIKIDDEWVWCDEPAPDVRMNEKDAIKYIRSDLVAKEQIVTHFNCSCGWLHKNVHLGFKCECGNIFVG